MVPYFIALSKNQELIIDPLSDIDEGDYKVTLKVYEVSAPSYFSEYLLEISITKSGLEAIHTD